MATLKLLLLGSPRLEQDGAPIDLGRRKAMALLAYLAVTRQGHSRDSLAALFWPDADQGRARTALRRALADINKALGTLSLDTQGDTLALPPDANFCVDVQVFRAHLAAWQDHHHAARTPCEACIPLLAEAVALYRDDFLSGFTLSDCPEFDDWQRYTTESLRQELAEALSRLVRYDLGNNQFDAAIPYARRWLALDALRDAPHIALMQLYARSGQRAAAMRQYREYVRLLEQELGVEPEQTITALYERIRQGEEGSTIPGVEAPKSAEPSAPAPHEAAALSRSEGEIRLATVLFAGMRVENVDWEANPEAVANLAGTLLQVVKQSVLKYEAQVTALVGESVQVVFGIPQAHEDDPERALRAALEIRATARTLGLSTSIGISTGQIYFGTLGAVGTQEVTAIGLVVNFASRLQDKAAAGQILASEATYRHTRRTFEFVPHALEIRGTAGSVAAYEVGRPLPNPEKVRGVDGLHTELVGRDEEMNKLKFALDAVLHGQGGIITLVGEAGLGKSRLVAELRQVALAAHDYRATLLWLESRCFEWNASTGYWPFIDLLRTYLYRRPEDEQDHARALITALEGMVAQGDLTMERAEEIAALLGNLLSIRFGTDWDDRLKNASPAQIRHQTFLAVYDFFVALARRHPLVLVFDDLHWADDFTLDLISLLMDAIASSPIVLMCVYRAQHQVTHLATVAAQKFPDRYTELRLRELTPSQSRRLLGSLLTVEDIPPDIEELILKKAWGNPFFMEEVIRGLIDAGTLYRSQRQWTIRAEADSSGVPESIQGVILTRVDRLSVNLRKVLRRAAVIGRLFQVDLLSQITPEGIDLEQALWSLEEAALIYRERVVPEVEYSFRHVLIHDAVYQTIAQQRRAELHRQVAEAMEARYGDNLAYTEQLAYHYNQSQVAAKAVEYLLRAGEKSRRAYFNQEAIRYFQQALKWLSESAAPTPAQTARQVTALTGLGLIYHGLGQEKEAEQHLRQAIEVGRQSGLDTPVLVQLYFWLGEVLHWQGRYAEQVQLGEVGLALLTGDKAESVEAVLMNQSIAVGSLQQGNHELFHALTARTADFIRRLPYSEELCVPYVHIILSLNEKKQHLLALHWLEVLEELAEKHHDLRALAEVYEFQWKYSFDSGDLKRTPEDFQRTLQLYLNIGDNTRTWRCLSGGIWSSLMLGNLAEAEKYAYQTLRAAEALQNKAAQSESYFGAGMVWLCQHSWEKATEAFLNAQRYAEDMPQFWTKWFSPYCLGRIYLRQGRVDRALAQFQKALTRFVPHHVPLGWQQHRWWSLLTCILSGLEAASPDHAAFTASCEPFAALKTQPAVPPLPTQWWLEPAAESRPLPPETFCDTFGQDLAAGWTWRDAFGDSSYNAGDGLTIRAANGRDLWLLNQSAPCLLRTVGNDFVAEAVCAPGTAQSPAVGGLVLWKNNQNFLRFALGYHGPHDVLYDGCVNNQDLIVGRGLLRSQGPSAPGISLRLVHQGAQVAALCSPDGVHWSQAGQVDFPVEGDMEIGLHGVGWLDRSVYPGPFASGAAIRFTSFRLWC